MDVITYNTGANNTRVSNNSFEGSHSPGESTAITGTNHAGRHVTTLLPTYDLPPPPYVNFYSSPPPSYHEVMGQGVESAEIPPSPEPSHQLEPGQDIESAELSRSPVIVYLISQERGTRLAGSPLSRGLAHRRVEATTSSHDPALGEKICITFCVFMIIVITTIAGLLFAPEQDGQGKS